MKKTTHNMPNPAQQNLFFDQEVSEVTDETFPTGIVDILDRVDSTRLERYAATRNFFDGQVTRLSPYISRGVISSRLILERLNRKGSNPLKNLKFLQELAWREYWQRIWISKGSRIDRDLRTSQDPVRNREVPVAINSGSTGIKAIDASIKGLYDTGYMHNHARMYTASIACNISRSGWLMPAKWMYYHLLDADWASNALSWQWVAGTNSSNKYYANQENINRFSGIVQSGTFLDVSYEQLPNIEVPENLRVTEIPEMKTVLPKADEFDLDRLKPTLIYNFYNLDPLWRTDQEANRILLIEPSVLKRYPVSERSVEFMLSLAQNIQNIKVFIGEFKDLVRLHKPKAVIFKEHPFSNHYEGIRDSREWLFDTETPSGSFSAFWKHCENQIGTLNREIQI